MAKILRRLVDGDQLSNILMHTLDDQFLIVNISPDLTSVLLMHPKLGLCIVSLHDDVVEPDIMPDGAILGVPKTGSAAQIIAGIKAQIGPVAKPIPIAWIAWFIYLSPERVRQPSMPHIHAGSDPEVLAEVIEKVMAQESRTPSAEEFSKIEEELRKEPGAIPAASPKKEAAPVSVQYSPKPPMPMNDPMLLLISHAVQDALGKTPLTLMTLEINAHEVWAPHKFLPALLVTAAENWALADLSTKDKGGFHVYLSTAPNNQSWSGHVVSDVVASSPLVLTLGITALLRTARMGDDKFDLSGILRRYANFMQMNGHATIELKRVALTIANSSD
jgi:hypothetical protein